MEDEYYALLHEAGACGRGYMADGIPFLLPEDAVQHIRLTVPDGGDKHGRIRRDAKACRETAGVLMPEIARLKNRIERMQESLDSKNRLLVRRRDTAKAKDVCDSLNEEINRNIERYLALGEVWRLLHEREYELYSLTRLKDDTGEE